MRPKLSRLLVDQVARRGLVVRRHPAVRRQAVLAESGVDVALDVGAAVGEFARELRDFGFGGRIVSFEPMATPFATLRARTARDGQWTCHRVALGGEPGSTSINVASNSDSSSLLPMADAHRRAAPQVDYVGTEDVDVARLDDLAPELLGEGETAFLKLDTQGFEREVMSGAEDTLQRCRVVQVELSFVPLYEGGPLIDEMVAALYDRGFRLAAVEPGFAARGGAVLQADGLFVRP